MSNPNARFVQAGCETGFNTGRLGPSGICDGPVVSFAQGRNRFSRTGLFQYRLHYPNFGFPDTELPSPGLGMIGSLQQQPTSILGSGLGGDVAPRMIQLKAQLQF